MRRTMNLWVFVTIIALMVLLFCCVNISIASSIKDVKANNQRAALELVDLSNKQDELEAEEETVGTDAFVEQQARDVYDFMMPDELRFVISFPEDQAGDKEPSL